MPSLARESFDPLHSFKVSPFFVVCCGAHLVVPGTANTDADEHDGASLSSSPPKGLFKAPPSHPDRSPSLDTNPFARRSLEQTVARKSSLSASSDTQLSSSPQEICQNPFLMRGRHLERPELPPLPPRKSPQHLPKTSVTSFGPSLALLRPAHVMSPLMKQSLEASRQGQNLKRAKEHLDRERVLQVLKTTSRTRSLSPPKSGSGPSAPEEVVPPPFQQCPPSSASSSGSSSLASLDKVAATTLRASGSSFPPPLPIREAFNFGTMPAPPTHPDRRPPTDPKDPSTAQLYRSKSLHASGTPLERRRPGSVEITNTDGIATLPWQSPHLRNLSMQGPSRNMPLIRTPSSQIQKTISDLQRKAQPKFDAVRYKAEASISRRGFVHPHTVGRRCDEGEEGLMADTQLDVPSVDSNSATDDELNFDDTRSDRFNHRRKEADNLKWPVGEGWTQL